MFFPFIPFRLQTTDSGLRFAVLDLDVRLLFQTFLRDRFRRGELLPLSGIDPGLPGRLSTFDVAPPDRQECLSYPLRLWF